MIHAHHESVRQPCLNLRIAQTYLAASDEKMARRTWQDVMPAFVLSKAENNRPHCQRGMDEAAFDSPRPLKVFPQLPCPGLARKPNNKVFRGVVFPSSAASVDC
jgi:hypothetical protein